MIPLLLTVLLACSDKSGDSGSVQANVLLEASQNYSYTGEMTVPVVETVSGQDVEICWNDVTLDIQCHDIDPVVDFDNIGLARFGTLTEAEVEDGLETNALLQRDNSGYVEYNTDHEKSCANLSEFSFFGTPFDIGAEYTEDKGTFLLMLTEGTEPGVNVKMITFLDPVADSDNTRVDIASGCGILDFTADMSGLTPVSIPAEGPWIIDWSALDKDGFGSELRAEDVTAVNIGFYEGQTPDDLAARFLDLEIIPDAFYTVELNGGGIADLSQAKDADGNAFSGLSGDGTWLLALRCGRCYNPAPVFLGVLETQ